MTNQPLDYETPPKKKPKNSLDHLAAILAAMVVLLIGWGVMAGLGVFLRSAIPSLREETPSILIFTAVFGLPAIAALITYKKVLKKLLRK